MIPAQDIQDSAWNMRREVIEMLVTAGSGHTASSLGLAEFFATMYLGGVLQYDPHRPWWEGRDRLVVSNGHVAPIWYAALAYAGFFPKGDLATYMQLGSLLQGHPQIAMTGKTTRKGLPGIENTGGSLGQGVSLAVGIALAIRLREQELRRAHGRVPRVFCLLSDAETQEGQTWEALQFAVMQKLTHLTFILDRNNIEIDADVDTISPIEPLAAKLENFGYYTLDVNGHDVAALRAAFEEDLAVASQPVVLIMHTIAGKGVSFMEGDFVWHDRIPDEAQTKQAIAEIEEHL